VLGIQSHILLLYFYACDHLSCCDKSVIKSTSQTKSSSINMNRRRGHNTLRQLQLESRGCNQAAGSVHNTARNTDSSADVQLMQQLKQAAPIPMPISRSRYACTIFY
jgi:hypothetical protein